ncbi:hypothetical protein EJB05_28285 [Eragrostis curvula]|uniref:Uncharacterized protein n=1 Tax=Eragrostis curvula TaxID=38414 RepID=A0A5J9UQD5_9POAL|nr:hypothetical protein EJB05_28285 [Eragrostis curvula]
MERTVNSLAYKGSISDAINQSRQEKKLFVVYISGEDEASGSLENCTLVDEHVVEVIGRCCVFLHLKQGNIDAAQFSAICILLYSFEPLMSLRFSISSICGKIIYKFK